jgi:hypothetical protein
MVGVADARETSGGGTPRYYSEFAGALDFYPYPTAAFLATPFTCEITYAAAPPDWTSGLGVLPSACDDLPRYFAAARVAMQRRHWPLAQAWWTAYLTQIQQYRLTSGLQFPTPQTQWRQPESLERQDEVRLLRVQAQQRAQQRQGRRTGRRAL